MQMKPKWVFLHFLSEVRRKEVKPLNGYSYLVPEQRREIERIFTNRLPINRMKRNQYGAGQHKTN